MRRDSLVAEALTKAFSFAEQQGIVTYDPFDLKGHPLALWTYRHISKSRQAIRFILYGGALLFPNAMRWMFGIRRQASAGGVAIYSNACCTMSQISGDSKWLDKSYELLKWLAANRTVATVGEGWGLPFNWQSVVFVPAGTGIGHTTMWCGNAFLSYFLLRNDKWAFEHAVRCCEFLIGSLNRTELPSGAVALSYTPLDRAQVINTNAEIASLLIRLYRLGGDKECYDLGIRLAAFVLENQNGDGSWYYFSSNHYGRASIIDGYHTGMIINGLVDLLEVLDGTELSEQCLMAIESGTAFYVNNLFEVNGAPRYSTTSRYPLDSYSVAQAIITLTKVSTLQRASTEMRNRARELVDKTLRSMILFMMDPDGEIIFQRYGRKKIRLNSLRWVQGIGCLALATYYSKLGLVESV